MSYNGTHTKYIEPPLKKGPSVNERWRYWYSGIADILIRTPQATHADIAKAMGKHPTTIGMIVGTDMFKEYFHQRREEFRKDHDHAIRAQMTDIAHEGLGIVLEQLKAKRTQIPLNVALKVTESALDRLGYAPDSQPSVVVNTNVDNRQQTVNLTGLSATDLEEARAALRQVEHTRNGSSLAPLGVDAVLEQGAEPIDAIVEESHDPSP